MIDEDKWILAAQTENIGSYHVGVRIEIFIGHRKFECQDDEDMLTTMEISRKCDEIQDILLEHSVRLDPASHERAAEQRKQILSLFEQPIYVQEIPNGYCDQYCCKHLPWFRVTTKIGPIVIGWRKRVISIDWSESDLAWTAAELFPDEDVTKGHRLIHAWGYENALSYLTKMHSVRLQPLPME